MEARAASPHSASPEDRSGGDEPLSAPSEFLAEFLSAIMRRQYAEALKYCRLILQYEPHNATARGFYPLLRHRTAAAAAEGEGASSGEESDASESPPHETAEVMEEAEDASSEGSAGSVGGSASSQSSLELDSEAASDSEERSGGSEAADGNGNRTCAYTLQHGDVENDNAAAASSAPRGEAPASEAPRGQAPRGEAPRGEAPAARRPRAAANHAGLLWCTDDSL